jgi:hypothetical protein
LTAVLASSLIGLDNLHSSQASSTLAAVFQPNGGERKIVHLLACGDQLAFAGYTITLSSGANAAQTAQAGLGLHTSDLAAEFLPLTSASPALSANAATQALALDRMRLVRPMAFGPMSQSALLAKLQSAPGVVDAEPVWLQSGERERKTPLLERGWRERSWRKGWDSNPRREKPPSAV